MRLKNKIILITASTRGIGFASAKACALEGGTVYLAARNKEAALARIKELEQLGGRAAFVYNDAAKPETFQTMIHEVIKQEGRLDVLVNNFGASDPNKDREIENTQIEDFLKTVTLNLSSVFLASQAAIPHMIKRQDGSIINISSIGGMVPDISQISYGTSKSAINYLTKLIAVQEARNHIRCNAILPGMTNTDAVQEALSPEFREFFLRHTPISRMALPEEIAAAVVYFASDESAYTTGQILSISGGFGLATPIFGDMAERLNKR